MSCTAFQPTSDTHSVLARFTLETKSLSFPLSNTWCVHLLFQPSAVWNTSACHRMFRNNLLSSSNCYLLICIFFCYRQLCLKKTKKNSTAQSLMSRETKTALPRIQRRPHNEEQNSIGALTTFLKLLFYSAEIKWASLSCMSLSLYSTFQALAPGLIGKASWDCWIMYISEYRRRHNAILEWLRSVCLLDSQSAAVRAVLFKSKHEPSFTSTEALIWPRCRFCSLLAVLWGTLKLIWGLVASVLCSGPECEWYITSSALKCEQNQWVAYRDSILMD